MEVFSDKPSREGPWRVTFENHIAVHLDSGQLVQDGQVLLSAGDDETKMLRTLGKPDEEDQQDEFKRCTYRLQDSIVTVTLGGFLNPPDAVNRISASIVDRSKDDASSKTKKLIQPGRANCSVSAPKP